MDNDDLPVFEFGLHYAGEEIWCQTIMNPTWYQVLFNRRPIAELVMNDDMEWMMAAGTVLPLELVDNIAVRIEARYR